MPILPKKRQILFDIMGERKRQALAQDATVKLSPPAPSRAPRSAPRKSKGSLPRATATRASAANAASRATALWCAAAGVVLIAIACVIWGANRGEGPKAPALQARAPGGGVSRGETADAPAQVFAVCALSIDYKTRAERNAIVGKVQETVNFLGYHADPEFRDVRGEPGKDPESGTFRVFVGSARSRSDLIPLRNKLAVLEVKKNGVRTRPFQNATVRLIDAAAPSAKETPR